MSFTMEAFLTILIILGLAQAQNNYQKLSFNLDPTSNEYIDYLNAKQNIWKAGLNFPQNLTHNYLTSQLGLRLDDLDQHLPMRRSFVNGKNNKLRRFFDCREKWPNCTTLNDIRDQGQCGGSWAFAVAAVISDRICINSGNKEIFRASPEDLIECCSDCVRPKADGCSPGSPRAAFKYWLEKGIVSGFNYKDTKTCLPSKFPTSSGSNLDKKPVVDTCRHKCQKSYNKTFQQDKHFGRLIYSVDNSVESIMFEIIENGPVQSAMIIHQDFIYYKRGIYMHVDPKVIGAHAVKIIGWGEEDHFPYWTVANSMGTNFGEDGFIRVIRGSNECGIETNINAGIPKRKYYNNLQ